MMLSLHNEPSQLVVTSLTDSKPMMKIPFGFETRSINIDSNLHYIYLISIFDQLKDLDNDMVVIDLAFKKHKLEEGSLTMRD